MTPLGRGAFELPGLVAGALSYLELLFLSNMSVDQKSLLYPGEHPEKA